VLALGASLGFTSVSGSLAAGALVAWGLQGWSAWLAGPFAASTAYLILSALELVLARAVRAVFGRQHLEERE
jgi:hypothetical protein